jgi:ubiquinone/menaquinone biosynthesis C-methylase UbiE
MTNDSSYLDPYRDAVADMGPGFEAQLWLSKDAQATRFSVIADALGNDSSIIADLGCGQGDLLVYLHEHNALPKHFIGVEGVDEMTHHAQQRIDQLAIDNAVFQTHDFVADAKLPSQLVQDAKVDTFIFSGSLNTLQMNQAQAVLSGFYNALKDAGQGKLIFNFLSNRHDKDRTPAQPPAVRFDPVEMLDWSLGRTPLVSLRHEYLSGHDVTIVMNVG